METEEFDVVVLATPLHHADVILPRDVTGVPQEFQRTVATFVKYLLYKICLMAQNILKNNIF